MDIDVLVVGAGPTGLTLGCELARRGVRVRVVDAATGPFTGSRGKGLQPRTLEVLDLLGVGRRLMTLGRFRLPMRHPDGEGGFAVRDLHPGAEPTPSSPYARPLMLPQFRVEEVLRDALTEAGGRVEFSRRLTDLTQDDDAATATFDDGERVTARWVVGCDGGSSTVRRLGGFTFLGETDETVRMLIADVRVEGVDRDYWHGFGGPDLGFVALCPLATTDRFQFQASMKADDDREPTHDVVQKILDQATGGTVRVLDVGWSSRWRLNERMVDRYRVGRLLLAGDAAHVHSPAGGQGMNTGIQDGANLGWKLAAVVAGADEALVDTYEAERLPIAADVLGLSARLTRRTLLDRGEDGERALQFGVSYRGGPLAPGVDGDGPRPGDRAPDATGLVPPDGDRPVRLFDLLRGREWTLLGFGVTPPEVGEGVRCVEIGPGGVVDTDGHARDAYLPVDGELVLVRPDGHVGIRTTDAAEVRAYLAGVLPGERVSA
ncbi:3-(3-hydroxyphenyl)propionate hydroxylase [Pseudonocardia sulfidoxydans NBRC 16205]|uniref:3-(3-hydroxyphenyl)propionate hydroxylase n=1 Tax=Pseudonocardia sulfidoxydans NBRC 16205 TaxID=1223511 RepID=A0A511DER3_9PSEU|nr:FAD-dependent monooxygenase [Pseudonocardia sulfidoxydans]GEL23027.1 3-(3-hydroxyphenyl)propionate hydroxylase [Pseudonocardia sulfidoxydans NBRC 16205]